tara:strand:- start:177 stop:398 length:222 start_codon:yes stop_codon:yes gene_type:complete
MSHSCFNEFITLLESDIRDTKNLLYEKEELLKKSINLLQNSCEHEIIVDFIDKMDGYKESVMIKYCKKCEKTF